MRQQETGGRILFMSSVAGNQAIATSSVYAMTKKGLEMLARSLVSEVSSYGITVNAIAPGATVTPAHRNRCAGLRADLVKSHTHRPAGLSERYGQRGAFFSFPGRQPYYRTNPGR